MVDKSKKNAKFQQKISSLLATDSKQTVGLLINERLLNMPPQLFPQMLKMTQEESGWAVDDVKNTIFLFQ